LKGDFYDNSILSYNYGPDTIRIWKNNLDSGFELYKKFVGVGAYPSGLLLQFLNTHIQSTKADLYLWLTRLIASDEYSKYLIKLNTKGDTVWT
jgi:hypothetical protein